MGHLATSKKRKYRYARVMAGLALAAAQEAERDFERQGERIAEYAETGEALTKLTQQDISSLTPFLQSTLSGMYADPRMGPVSLKSLVGRKPELVQAGRRVKEGLDIPSELAFRQPEAELYPGEQIASTRRIASKRPEATLELTGEETEALMPIAERAQEWAGYRWPIATTGAMASEYAKTYNKKMAEYQMWSAVEARYRRKHASEVSKWKRIGTLVVAAIATIVSFGALGPVVGALGGSAAAVSSFGTGGLGTILTTTALGAAGGAISGGWKGALIGGIGGLAGGLLGGVGGGAGEVAQAAGTAVREAGTFATRMSPITGQLVSSTTGLPFAATQGPLFGLTAAIAPQAAGTGAGVGGQITGGLTGMLKSLAPYAKEGLKFGGKAYKSFSELDEQNEYLKRLFGEQFSQKLPVIPEGPPPLPTTT